ncbi:MAG: tetratricopeptide repeat protein [Candidatus Lernaella stagnicola]|nr:tetratricopeptide repeat protein [Candidatus Lernaella stagnicola]
MTVQIRLVLISIVVLTLVFGGAACTVKRTGANIGEADLDDEATPQPADPKTATPATPSFEDPLARIFEDDTRDPEIDERDLPVDPDPIPDVAPPMREPLSEQGPLATVDPHRERSALNGHGGTSQRKAALALTRDGRSLLQQGNNYLAEKRFERALSIDPQSGQAYLGLAEVRFQEKKWGQAADLATKAALRLRKENYFRSRAHLLAAKAMINTDRPGGAYKQVQLALKVDPDNREAALLKYRLEKHLGIQAPLTN